MSKDTETNVPETGAAPAPRKRSIGRRIWRGFRNTLLAFFGLVVALLILVQLPFFQTWLGRVASGWLSRNYDITIRVERVAINFFRGSVKLRQVYVQDNHGDTLIAADILKVKLDHISTRRGEIVMKSVILQGGFLNMRRYKDDPKPNLSLLIDKFKPKKKPDQPKKKGKQWLVLSNELILDECQVRVRNDQATVRDADFLPNDIRISEISGKVSEFTVKGDSIRFQVHRLTAMEASGIVLREFSSEVLICSHEMAFRNFYMRTPRSELSGYYSMRYRNWGAFSHYEDSVVMVADLDLSDINLKDIAFFSGNLRGIDANFRFKGGVKGPLSNLKGRDIALYFGSVTQLVGKVEMTGLPDINNTFIYFDLNKFVTNYNDLRQIPMPPFHTGQKLNIPPLISRMGVMKFKGNFTGFIRDFTAFGELQTGIGSAKMDLSLSQDANKDFNYSGSLDVKDFNVGRLINNEKLLGKVSLQGTVNGKNFDKKRADAKFNGTISTLELNGYTYHDIQAGAFFKEQTVGGLVRVDDENAQVLFNGTVNLADANRPVYSFYSDVKNMELRKINLLKTDSAVRFNTQMVMDFKGKNIDDIVGTIRFYDTECRFGSKCYDLDSLRLESIIHEDSTKSITLHSTMVDADFNGRFKFIPLYNEIKRRINEVLPSMELKVDDKIKPIDQNFDFNVQFKNISQLTALFLPKLQVAKNSIAYGRYDSKRNDLTFDIRSSSVRYNGIEFNGWLLEADNNGGGLVLHSTVNTLYLTDSVTMDNLTLDVGASRDSLDITLWFKNRTPLLNSGKLHANTYLGNAPRYDLHFSDSYFYYEDSLWRLNDDNRLTIDDGLLEFDNLALLRKGNLQPLLSINGRSKKNATDGLRLDLHEFPVDLADFFLKNKGITLSGSASGNVELFSIFTSPYFTSDLQIQSFGLNGISMGDLHLNSAYEPNDKAILLNTSLNYQGEKTVSIRNGKFYPFRKEDQFSIAADIRRVNISAFEKFVQPIFSDLRGYVSGRFMLSGSATAPVIYSNLNIQGGALRLVYLNALFQLEMDERRDIVINNYGIRIPPVKLTDRYKGVGYLEGSVSHEMFRDIALDLDITTRNLCMMETNAKLNEQFYGSAFATGNAEITGPLNNLVVKADMKTEKNTVLNIPIRSTSTVSENSFVVFVQKSADTSKTKTTIKPVKSNSNFTVELSVEVTPDAQARIIFDETVGDVLTVNGSSDEIRLELDTKGKFNLYGAYEISKGNYLFTLQNLVNKPFIIKPGSSISFSGNPYLANINATAIYQANASLYPIVSAFMDPTQAENFRRSVRVNCELTLTNTLANMLLAFNLEVPTVDESTRSLVKAAINTEEEMNRQVFSLLILNQFLPPEATGGGSSTSNLLSSGLGSTSLELLSGQLNNWLSKLTKNVNVNVKYKAGDAVSTDQVSVALSTQLFNDRISIDGDVGVGGQRVSEGPTQNQIVGNVTVEFKVNTKGSIRVKAFNRSNDQNLLKNSAPYTQGIGISYRKEFDSWRDLFPKRKKKQKNSTENDTNGTHEERRIEIESDDTPPH